MVFGQDYMKFVFLQKEKEMRDLRSQLAFLTRQLEQGSTKHYTSSILLR